MEAFGYWGFFIALGAILAVAAIIGFILGIIKNFITNPPFSRRRKKRR